MATIRKTPSGTWKALIRKKGWPASAKTFRTKRDAEDWARRAEDDSVRPHDVDAFWLQRQLARYYPDAYEANAKTDATLDILGADTDLRACENALMDLYNYTNFDLVQLLTKNRDVVVWCTRLARAGADFVAVSAGVWSYPEGPAAAVSRFKAVLAGASEEI